MKTKITLIADEGMILTDGEHFGKTVYLPSGKDGSAWHEITEEEYSAIMAEKEAAIMEETEKNTESK